MTLNQQLTSLHRCQLFVNDCLDTSYAKHGAGKREYIDTEKILLTIFRTFLIYGKDVAPQQNLTCLVCW